MPTRIVVAILLIASSPCLGESDTSTVGLPHDYADFAMHPETGGIAALSAETNQVDVFRLEDFEGKKTAKPSVSIQVGSAPVSVFYKKYADQEVFAVVCSGDSHMFLINARANQAGTFEVIRKIDVAQAGVSSVFGSNNEEDPFVYYCYGSGHDSATGVVNLKTMSNQGKAFGDSMDAAISANGDYAYRRGPWSPSGFDALKLTTDFSEAKPKFAQIYDEHRSTPAYTPDPFNQYVFCSTAAYPVGLGKATASLPFVPYAFFREQPIIIGMKASGYPSRSRSSRDRSQSNEVKLLAASYNTLTQAGEPVTLDLKPLKGERSLPRGVRSQADFKRLSKRTRMFADEGRKRVVFARGDAISLVPLEKFAVPAEPFLMAELTTNSVLVDQAATITVKSKDSRVKIRLDDLPQGMQAAGNVLTWTPESDQIGTHTIVATLDYERIQRTVRFDVSVKSPSVQLPFAPTGFSVNRKGSHAFIWKGPVPDRYGRNPDISGAETIRVAVVNLKTGTVEAEKKLGQGIRSAIVTDRVVAITPMRTGGSTLEVLKLSDLTRVKTLVAESPISRSSLWGDKLVLETKNAIEVYDAASLQKRRTFATSQNSSLTSLQRATANPLTDAGLFVAGVLYGPDLQPQFVTHPGSILTASGVARRRQNAYHPPGYLTPNTRVNSSSSSRSGPRRVAFRRVPGANRSVALDSQSRRIVPSGTHMSRATIVDLILTVSGDVDARRVIARETREGSATTSKPALECNSNTAFVMYDRSVFAWSLPQPKAQEESAQLEWIPTQSVIALHSTGTTRLENRLKGGKKPIDYSVPRSVPGMTVNAKTGVISLDNRAVSEAMLKQVVSTMKSESRGQQLVGLVQSRETQIMRSATQILGRKPKGFPLALPIEITATDADLASKTVQYYVIAEVPMKNLLTVLTKEDAATEKQRAEATTRRMAAAAAAVAKKDSGSVDEIKKLSEKVAALEDRIDLLTRQLAAVLKKLDDK